MAEVVIDLEAGTWRCQGITGDNTWCNEMVKKSGLYLVEFATKADSFPVALCKQHATEPLRIRVYDDEAGS